MKETSSLMTCYLLLCSVWNVVRQVNRSFFLQNNASKLLLAIMESRHDSENAERILYNMRPKELVRKASYWSSNGLKRMVSDGSHSFRWR